MTKDGLAALRAVFASFIAALVASGIAVVVVTASSSTDNVSDSTANVVLVAGAVVSLAGLLLLRFRADCSTPAALARSYRTWFFLRLASAELSAAAGFVASVLSGDLWRYGVGVVVALAGYSRLAPTDARLERMQQQLTADGCGQSLVDGLRGTA